MKVTRLIASSGLSFSINKLMAYFDNSNLDVLLEWVIPPPIEPEISNKITKYRGSSDLGIPSLQDLVKIAKNLSGSSI